MNGAARMVGALVCMGLLILSVGCGSQLVVQDNILRYSLGAEPETLDPRKATGTPEAGVVNQIFEGLTRLDANGNPVAACADRWTLSADGLTYTFTIRTNAKWSNGDKVTAQDFERSWKQTLSPELGSKYAYQLYYLKHAEQYNQGKVKSEQVGVRALDERTLEVVLEKPTPYFLALTAFHTLFPVHQPTVSNDPSWADDPHTVIGNGPFQLTAWQHNSKLDFVKNPHYWGADQVRLQQLEFVITESANTELAMFDNNQIDIGGNVPLPEFARLQKEGKLVTGPLLGTYFYVFNVAKPPFDQVKVRKAFALALDRQMLIDYVLQGGQTAAMAWVPYGIIDAATTTDFRTVGGNYFADHDVDQAQRLLAEAGYPGGNNLPPLRLLYNTGEGHKAIAEAIQEMWKKNLGVDAQIVNQEWKVFLNSKAKGDYQIARHGWVGDYIDPMSFMDMWVTGGGNNEANYSNPAYDQLIEQAKNSNDQQVRLRLLHQAEAILMNDMVVLPIYFYTQATMVQPYVKGFQRCVLGFVYFRDAYIEQ